MSRICRIESVTLREHQRVLAVRVHCDDGLIGHGETYDKVPGSQAALHGTLAPLLLGQDSRAINALTTLCFDNIRYHGFQGAEWRAFSAIELALWDIQGKRLGVPVVELFGGAVRADLPCYNTCISYGPCNDYQYWQEDPAGLARSLLADGYRMAKVWPFDRFSEASLGQHLSQAECAQGAATLAAMREVDGGALALGLEGHSRWALPAARRIVTACEDLGLEFLEDLVPAHDVAALAALNQSTRIPLVGSETLFTRFALRELIERAAVDIVMVDPMWCGGLGETRACAQLAATYGLPVILHNLGGPVAHAAACQIAATIPNLWAVESSRALSDHLYPQLGSYQPRVSASGRLALPTGPGLGAELPAAWFCGPSLCASEGNGAA
ncbi:MAG: mandelate racemase/muconate lactonizing enzyme family protein, partial [Planctomycetota bacterium]